MTKTSFSDGISVVFSHPLGLTVMVTRFMYHMWAVSRWLWCIQTAYGLVANWQWLYNRWVGLVLTVMEFKNRTISDFLFVYFYMLGPWKSVLFLAPSENVFCIFLLFIPSNHMISPDTESPNTGLSNWKNFLFWKYCQLRVTIYIFGSLHASWLAVLLYKPHHSSLVH